MKSENDFRKIFRCYTFILPHWHLIAVSVVFMAAYSATLAMRLYVLKPLFDGVVVAKNINALWFSAKYVALLTPLMFVANIGQIYFSQRLLWSIVVELRNRICERLLPQSVGFFENRRSGDLVSRITNDVNAMQRALQFLVGEIVLQPLQLIAYAATAIWACWQLSVLCFVALPALVLPMAILGRKVKKSSLKSLRKLSDLTDIMQQMFRGIRIVKAFKMEDVEHKQFRDANLGYFKGMMKVARARALAGGIVELSSNIGLIVTVVLGGYLITKRFVTPGYFCVFIGAFASMYHPIKKLTKSYNNLMQALPASERIFELIDAEPEIKDEPDAVELDGVKKGIAFRNVYFAYDTEPVLKNINLEVKKGEVVALVGHSGAGKSTLCDLVARFYDPQRGSIEIDGVDIRRIKRSSLLDNIAIVGQETFLFNKSIAENIRYGKRDATMDEIIAAAKAANIHDFIASLPDGYDTEVGEMGVKLSGGQRQRLAIARAILKNASILILDEATSSLDSESERMVQNALQNLMKGKTTFLIAHRLSTVLHADKIVVLKNGEIVQCGDHNSLLAQGGEYRKLYEMQFADVAPEVGAAEA